MSVNVPPTSTATMSSATPSLSSCSLATLFARNAPASTPTGLHANHERFRGGLDFAQSLRGGDLGERCCGPATWSSVCAADTVTRRRELPGGTVGGRIAGTRKPFSSSVAEAASAPSASPMITGRIADGWPGASRSMWPRRALAERFALRRADDPEGRQRRGGNAGGVAVVKMNERARLRRSSISGPGPATYPPRAPSVFDRVPTRSASTPASSGWGPSTACASSMTRSAPWPAQR